MKNGKPNLIRDIIELLVTIAVWGILLAGFFFMIRACAGETARQARRDGAEASVEREGAIVTAKRYGAGREAEEVTRPLLEVYTEGCGEEPPEWWRPDEEMAAVWTADEGCNILATNLQSNSVDYNAHPPIGIDPGGVDWNVCTTVWGWDGHGAEVWELDLFARIFYREFWQPNLTLCEAGCDAMLGLWDLYGGTLFETISHVNEDGSYTFSTYPGVWEIEYDPYGLAWCKAFCEERFYKGPVWPAQYFRKGQYHDWGEWSPIPAYEIDGIYFSVGRN